MKNNFVYVFVKNDELELPIIVADTIEEISSATDFNWSCLQRACLRNSVIANKYRIRKVDIRDPEERFLFKDYKTFCKEHSISASNFKSLQRYRQYCFGV